jgi:hypothetical protein
MSRSIVEEFWDDVPRKYMEDVFRGLPNAFEQACDDTFARHDKPEATNLIPLECRANVQRLFRDVAEFHEGVEAVAIQGEEGEKGWWYYTKVTAGGVVMTSMSAKNPSELVRNSRPRLKYSRLQRFLFEELEPPPRTDVNVYGLLLIGHEPRNARKLGFAVIRFPLLDYSDYHPEFIDLFDEFPDIAADLNRADGPQDGDYDDIQFRDQDDLA